MSGDLASGLRIRQAAPADVELIRALIAELAEYERLASSAVAKSAELTAALFCDSPRVFALMAERDGQPAGFALYFYSFSTFLGRHGLYVEDVFVRPAHRGRGIGRALFERLAAQAVAEGCGRMEWSVLDWNEPALRFYRGLGAEPMSEWTVQRLTGDALRRVAAAGA